MKSFLKATALIGIGAALAHHLKDNIHGCISGHFTPENKAKMIVKHLDKYLNLSYSQKDTLAEITVKKIELYPMLDFS